VLNPNLAVAWQRSGWVRVYNGEHTLAIKHLTQAIRLNPLDPLIFLAQSAMAAALFFEGRNDEASQWASRALQHQPGWPAATRLAAVSNACAGRMVEARAAVARLHEVYPNLRLSDIAAQMTLKRPQDVARWQEGFRLASLSE
jgi:tetratricopeptide (TPR) repeat protein